MNGVMSVIITDVEVAIAILSPCTFFVAKGGLIEVYYAPDGLGNDDIAVAVNEFHVQTRPWIEYKISE